MYLKSGVVDEALFASLRIGAQLGDVVVPQKSEFDVLGSRVSATGETGYLITLQLRKAAQTFWKPKDLFLSRDVGILTKSEIRYPCQAFGPSRREYVDVECCGCSAGWSVAESDSPKNVWFA